MAKRIVQIEFWPGPLRPTPPRKAVYSKKCVKRVGVIDGEDIICGKPTINGEAWCYACKDPDGYAERLRLAHQAAHQRCLEAYPVCKHCGCGLSQAQVEAGKTAHEQHYGDCRRPEGPLARRVDA